MIPKIIHYCWFGKGLMPKSQKDCIKGWKKLMPDYTFMRWDESTFDLEAHPLAKYACEVKKYALASDVCRYNVLTEYGGIYLDTDVEVFKRFDDFLDCNFFSAIELYQQFYSEGIEQIDADGNPLAPGSEIPNFEMLTSTMACCPNFEMICRIRDYYNSVEASPERALHYREWVDNDRLVARYCAEYGYKYLNKTQYFGDGMVVYGTGLFGYLYSPDKNFSISFHHNAATWRSDEEMSRKERRNVLLDKLGLLGLYKRLRHLFIE